MVTGILKYKKVREGAKAPTVAHVGEDVAYDFYAAERVVILPGFKGDVPLGVAIEQGPVRGGLFGTRSGMAKKGLFIVGGVIDAGYRGELVAMIYNGSKESYIIENGDKCVQMIPIPVITCQPIEVEELSESTRGEGGFGSTGK